MENYNGVNDYIHFGKRGELASNRREEQELSMLCLHILQSSLAFINTLMIQDTLAEPEWVGVLGDADRRGLTPLFHANMGCSQGKPERGHGRQEFAECCREDRPPPPTGYSRVRGAGTGIVALSAHSAAAGARWSGAGRSRSTPRRS